MSLALRPATPADAQRLLAWRNDPVTRRFAFDHDEVRPESHAAWLERKLTNPGCEIWIAEDGGEPVGQVRFDRLDARTAEVDVAVAPAARGRGHGSALIAAGVAAQRLGVTRVRAQVAPDNEASLRAFARAGFAEVSRNERAVVLERDAVSPA